MLIIKKIYTQKPKAVTDVIQKNQMEALIFFSSFRFTHPYGININLLGKALTDARAR